MVRIQRLPLIALALCAIVAGLDSAATAGPTAYASSASVDSPTQSTRIAAIGSTGHLSSPRLVGFTRAPSGTAPARVLPLRFRTRDDVSFAADKQRSNLGSTINPRDVASRSIPLASVATASTEVIGPSFPAMTYELQTNQSFGPDQRVWPPDTQIGVGASQVVEFVNSSGSIWSKSGQVQAISDLNDFFVSPVDKTVFSVSDPRIFYDSASGRWFSSAMAFDAANDGRVYLSVSSNSDPALGWYQYTIESNNQGTLYDQPRLGLSDDKVVLSWDDYSTVGFTGSETWVLDKGELIAGAVSPSFWTTGPDLTRFALLPSTSLTPTLTEYVVYSLADSSISGYLGYPAIGVVAITGSPANNNVIWTESFASDPSLANTVVPPDALQPGGPPVATNDDRLLAAVWQNGILWVTANDGCTPTGDVTIRSCLRLFQLTTGGTSPAIQQSFDIGSPGEYLSFPTIILDAAGNVFLGLSGSSSIMFPSFLTSAVPSGGGLLDVQPLTILQPGIGAYVDCAQSCTGSPNNNNRWGDYGGAAIDPTDPTVVWLAGEFAASATDPLDWGTGVAEVSFFPLPSTATPSPTSTDTPINSTAPSTPTPTNTPVNSTATSTTSPTASASPTSTETSTIAPTPDLTPTSTETSAISPTATATETNQTPLPSATPTSSGTVVPPTLTPSPTETPNWIGVPVGQPTVVTTVVGALMVDIVIPPGDPIARIAVSTPVTPVPIVPIDPNYQEVAGAAIVVDAVDASNQPITTLGPPITISIGFRVPAGDNANPLLAKIYTLNGGAPVGLDTVVTSVGNYGSYLATAQSGHLSPFVIFAPPVAQMMQQAYLPLVVNRSPVGGW